MASGQPLLPPRRPPVAPTRRVVAAAFVLLVLGGLGAAMSASAGASFNRDLELAQPALARTAPVITDPQTPRLARRVFLVIVDGLRFDRSFDSQLFDDLRRRGVDLEVQSHYPSWSRPNYVSILTGVPPTASGVRTNFHNTPVMLDSLMDRARDAGLHAAFASDYSPLPSLFLRPPRPHAVDLDSLDIDALADPLSPSGLVAADAKLTSPFQDARYAPWPGGFVEAGGALADGEAELVVLLIGAVDAAGHAHGADSEQYREAVQIVDRALASVLARADLSRDAIVITADHGHTDRGGHGGIEPEVMAVPLIIAGAGVDPNGTELDGHLVDVAPTVAALLGIPAPGHGLGHTLDNLLALDPPAKARRAAADAMRLAHSVTTIAFERDRAEAERGNSRLYRIALVAVGTLVALVLAVLLIRRRVLRLDLRVLAISIPTFFVVYGTLIGTLGQRFSPSLVPAEGSLVTALLKYGIAGIVVQVLASLWALRTKGGLGERLAAANGIAWTGLMATMIPAGLMWAYFPAPYVEVPGPFWLVLIPAVQVAVACAAIEIALTLFAELIVFAAAATRRHT